MQGSRELGVLMEDYIKSEETSYTIIAFPLPSIGEKFEEIFLETIRLNTLDNDVYKKMQQVLIDVLDTGEQVLVRGSGGNRTNLVVRLHKLSEPESQTNFENCTADVNIPVGEVFTSPVLAGTNGVLHVGRVFSSFCTASFLLTGEKSSCPKTSSTAGPANAAHCPR